MHLINVTRHPIVCCLLLLIVNKGYCQGLETVLSALKNQQIGKVVKNKFEYRTSEATYLGQILDINGKTKYYVVKEFYKVKAAVVYHGHSRMLFFNPNKNLVAQSIVDMPDELPYRLYNNFLYFKYMVKGVPKDYKEHLKTLPKMICVSPHACYDVTPP